MMLLVLPILLGVFHLCHSKSERIPKFHVSDFELVDLANELRSVDDNKAQPGQIELNYQGRAPTKHSDDNASERLFTKVNPSLLRKPTYQQFIALHDNYNRQTGVAEPVVSVEEERSEIANYLTTLIDTKPWKALYKFLHNKGHPYAKDPETWRSWIEQLWFEHYSRAKGVPDTSGFEHVFMGEAKRGKVSGMHNWIRFYLLEKDPKEKFDYKGLIDYRFGFMAAVKYSWFREMKKFGSFLIGTSPEFDMALYTMCFLSRRGRRTCDIEIDGCPISLTSYDLRQNKKVYIGTVYPDAGPMTKQCRLKHQE